MKDDYAIRQATMDAEYEREYRAWVESLPAKERLELESLGLAEASVAHYGNGSAFGDAADSPLMSEGIDPMLMPEPEPEVQAQPVITPSTSSSTTTDSEPVWDAVRRVLGEILSHENARLTVECIALVSGLSYTGASMTEIAQRHGITRAAVSKRCVELTELLDLRPSRAMRSLTARESYRNARIRSTSSHENSHIASKPQGRHQPGRHANRHRSQL